MLEGSHAIICYDEQQSLLENYTCSDNNTYVYWVDWVDWVPKKSDNTALETDGQKSLSTKPRLLSRGKCVASSQSEIHPQQLIWKPRYLNNMWSTPKGVFNLSNQLSNFSKNWQMQRDRAEFC